MRPQRPASASVGASRPSPYVTAGAKHFNSRPVTPAEDRTEKSAGKCAPGRQVRINTSASGEVGGEVAVLQGQLRAVLQRQSEVDADHQRNMTAYRHRLRRLYNDNAVLRNIIAAAENRRRNGDHIGSGASAAVAEKAPATVTEAEYEHLQQRINFAARKTNQLQHDIVSEEKLVRRATEAGAAANAQLQTSIDKELFAGGNASVLIRVQKMEHKLDAVLLQQRSVGIAVGGYEHHLRELTAESRRFEGRMKHLEGEYAARHRDHIQLINFYQNAQDDYRRVSAEREELLRMLHHLRTAKERALADKSSEVTAALRVTQRREHHLSDLQQQLEEEAQQLEYAEQMTQHLEQRRTFSRPVNDIVRERSTSTSPADGAYADGSGGGLTAEEGERLAAYEKAFRTMMQAARVDRIENLITAFEDEHASHEQLARQVAEAREAHAALSAEVKRLQRRSEEAGGVLPSAGSGKSATPAAARSSKLLAELRTFVREEQAELHRQITANEADEVLLLEVARRVDAIAGKAAAYRPDVCIPLTAEQTLLVAAQGAPKGAAVPAMNSKAMKQGRSALLAHLTVLKQKLFALAEDATQAARAVAVTADGTAAGRGDFSSYLSSEVTAPAAAAAVVRSTQLVIPGNNVRVNFAKKPAPNTANIGSSRGYLQQQQLQAAGARSWAGNSADSGRAQRGARGGGGPRNSVFTDFGDGSEDGALLLLSSGAPADDVADPLVDSATSSGDAGCTDKEGRERDAAVAENEGAPSGSTSANGGGDGAGSQWMNRNDDPLDRGEVKKMSEAIQLRARRRLDRERLASTDLH